MAQKVQVLVVDDIDGSEATETVSFGLNDSWFARRGWHPGKLAGPRGVNPGKPRPPVHHATKAQNKIIAIPNGFSSFAVIQVGIKKGRPPVAKPRSRPFAPPSQERLQHSMKQGYFAPPGELCTFTLLIRAISGSVVWSTASASHRMRRVFRSPRSEIGAQRSTPRETCGTPCLRWLSYA
jgi:hypothetical protein